MTTALTTALLLIILGNPPIPVIDTDQPLPMTYQLVGVPSDVPAQAHYDSSDALHWCDHDQPDGIPHCSAAVVHPVGYAGLGS